MIQLINYSGKYSDSKEILVSNIANLKALDEFKINIIDLSNEEMWKNEDRSYDSIDCMKDIKHLGEMIKNKRNSNVIVVLPQNVKYLCDYDKHNGKTYSYKHHYEIKNKLESLRTIVSDLLNPHEYDLLYENTKTKINTEVINACFYFHFANVSDILTSSYQSNKATTIKLFNGTIATTLDVSSPKKMMDFLKVIGLIEKKTEEPAWINSIKFLDDEQKMKIVEEDLLKIEELKSEIEAANSKLGENNRYKSVLYENSDKLVEIVFEMLADMLSCDFDSFVDEKKEDFLVKLKNITFIGEIKGVTNNVRSEYISQLEVHYRSYLDTLQDNSEKEDVKAILIINHQRNTDFSMRNPVNEDQIKLSLRNESLIIETYTLMRLFERYKRHQICNDEIIDMFKNEKGLLEVKENLAFDDIYNQESITIC